MKGKKEKENKGSARKKLIPAVAMLTTSAIMLSTATYAWFTMNKEVQMTGLNMTATTAGALEISLGGVDSTGTFHKTGENVDLGAQPGDTADEKSWTSAIAVGEYYKTIPLVKPSSSNDAQKFFDAEDATNAGQTATKFTAITEDNSGKTGVTLQDTKTASGSLTSDTTKECFYIDIPVHLRTSSAQPDGATENNAKIYYKMVINNGGETSNLATEPLYKAVRVAFLKATNTGVIESGSPLAKILAQDNAYYEGGPVISANDETHVGTKANDTSTITTTSVFTSNTDTNYPTNTGTDSGLTIPYANGQTYGHTDFIVRVWLEGESTSCYNVNAGQKWNIDLAFSMGQFDTTTTNS